MRTFTDETAHMTRSDPALPARPLVKWFAMLLLLVAALPVMAADPAQLLEGAIGDRPLVLLGEMHGTREIPAVTGALVAHYARSGPVLLGLEASGGDQPRVDRYLDSDGGLLAKADLLAGEHWQDATHQGMHDGRDSAAMFALIEQVRRLRKLGADVDIVMFDVAGPGDRDARMAKAIRAAVEAHPHARTLVLTGNVHAMTGTPPQLISAGKPYVAPPTVGHHLADLDPLSIAFRAREGAFWACQQNHCGEVPLDNDWVTDPLPRIERGEEGDSWALTLFLPRFTASSPAIGRP